MFDSDIKNDKSSLVECSTESRIDSEAQIKKLESLGQFAGGIAHDFNNILSIIEGYVHIAIRKMERGELEKEDLEKILKSTERGAGLTQQLLSFGKMKVDVEDKINLAEALRDFHVLLRPVLGDTINLYMTMPEYPVWINISNDQVTQILLNLSINARDAMPNGGDLSILFTPCKDEYVPKFLKKRHPDVEFVKINVTDTGQGIPQSIFDKIFDPFFTTKTKSNGSGLGLSVVYGIVNQLGGGIEISSKVGHGTCFSIYLPIAESPTNKEVFPTDISGMAEGDDKTTIRINNLSTSELKNKTILIAEDEPELRCLLEYMFKEMEMNVLSARNGNDALLVQDEYDDDIDFLLTDVVMPEMNGIKLGELFGSVRPNSEVIYMSGYPFIDGRDDLGIPKDAIFINKPLRENKIKKILERAMERRRERLGE